MSVFLLRWTESHHAANDCFRKCAIFAAGGRLTTDGTRSGPDAGIMMKIDNPIEIDLKRAYECIERA
jgi:hypothetical protein